MGDIIIKIPQKINRSFKIDSRKGAEEILRDLERRFGANGRNKMADEKKFDALKRLVSGYRSNPDSDTRASVDIAESLREGWNR